MRVKDEYKKEAIFKASIKLVNTIGLSATSMSKIAKEAGVSPATIYVYFENKEDLLNSTYIMVKREMALGGLKGVDFSYSVADLFRQVWFNFQEYTINNTDYLIFTEQFANSPIVDKVNEKEIAAYFEPLIMIFKRGQVEGIIKELPVEILIAYAFYPILSLIKNSCKSGA